MQPTHLNNAKTLTGAVGSPLNVLPIGLSHCLSVAAWISLASVFGAAPLQAATYRKDASPTAYAVQCKVAVLKPARLSLNDRMCRAAEAGNLPLIRTLVTRGANIDAIQQNGWTALMLATAASHLAVVQFLLAHGADVHHHSTRYNDVDALMLAVSAGNVPISHILLAHGADVNETDVSGNTPLMLALGNGNLTPSQEYDITEFLINSGANLNKRNSFGDTALGYTHRSRFEPPLTKVISLLIASGAKS